MPRCFSISIQSEVAWREALRAFYQHRPSLVILDILMPELDGWEVLRRIRDLADTPVIMLTALSGEADVVRALDAGADEYVSKPFSPAALAARVRATLRRTRRMSWTGVHPLRLDQGRLVGILTETDVLRHVVGEDACCTDVETIVVSYP